MEIPEKPSLQDYNDFIKYIMLGVNQGRWSLTAARRAMDVIEHRRDEVAKQFKERRDAMIEARRRGQKDYERQFSDELETFFDVLIQSGGNATIDRDTVKDQRKRAHQQFNKSQLQLQQDIPPAVSNFQSMTLPQMAQFIREDGLSVGSPEMRAGDRPGMHSSIKGVHFAAEALLEAAGLDASFLKRPASADEYAAWIEDSSEGRGAEWGEGIELDESAVPTQLFEQLGIAPDSAQGRAVYEMLQGALRENVQFDVLSRHAKELDDAYAAIENGENYTAEDVARIRQLSLGAAHASLAAQGITLESETLEEISALGTDPALNYGVGESSEDMAQHAAMAKRVALAQDGQAALRELQASESTLAAGIDEQGRPIRGFQRDDPMASNPFMAPVMQRIAMTQQVQNSPLFHQIASDLGMNLAEGERPTVGQLNRVLRAAQRDKRRAYRPSGHMVEVDVVDRDRVLEVGDGQFISYIDEKTGDFVTKDELMRRSEEALANVESNPVVEFDLDDDGVRALMTMGLDEASSRVVKDLHKLYATDPAKARGSSVVVDRKNNTVAVIGPGRVVEHKGSLNPDQVAAINDAALNPNVAHVATDPEAVRAGNYGTSLQSLESVVNGKRHEANAFAPPGLKVSMETPTVKKRGMLARQKYGGDQGRFVLMGEGREGEQILYTDIRGKVNNFEGQSPEEIAAATGVSVGWVNRQRRKAQREHMRTNKEFRRGRGELTTERNVRSKPEEAVAAEEEVKQPMAPPEQRDGLQPPPVSPEVEGAPVVRAVPPTVDQPRIAPSPEGVDRRSSAQPQASVTGSRVEAPAPEKPSAQVVNPTPYQRSFAFNAAPPTGSFYGVTGDPDFPAALEPRLEQGGPKPTYGAALTGIPMRMTPSERSGQRFARGHVDEARGYELNPMVPMVESANMQEALRSLGFIPQSPEDESRDAWLKNLRLHDEGVSANTPNS